MSIESRIRPALDAYWLRRIKAISPRSNTRAIPKRRAISTVQALARIAWGDTGGD
jgi:hypothetical protein